MLTISQVSTPAEIQGSFASLFSSLPAGTLFSKISSQASADVCFITWKAGGTTGQTTLVIKNEKIILDYSFLA